MKNCETAQTLSLGIFFLPQSLHCKGNFMQISSWAWNGPQSRILFCVHVNTTNKRFAAHRPAALTLMSLKLNVTLQYLQFRVLSSHSRSLCLSLSFRRMEAWQDSHCTRSCSQRPSCWAWEKKKKKLHVEPFSRRHVFYSFTLTRDNETDKMSFLVLFIHALKIAEPDVLWVIEKLFNVWMAVGVVQELFASAVKTNRFLVSLHSKQSVVFCIVMDFISKYKQCSYR